jgi:hypothetical protein
MTVPVHEWLLDDGTPGADYARAAVAMLASGNPNHSARAAMAKLAVAHGNYTDEGKAIWREYLEAGCPAS